MVQPNRSPRPSCAGRTRLLFETIEGTRPSTKTVSTSTTGMSPAHNRGEPPLANSPPRLTSVMGSACPTCWNHD